MQRVARLIISIGILPAVFSCSPKKRPDPLQSWQGKYFYEEEPVKALAGYYMAMDWELNIHKEAGTYVARVEVNGQQTNLHFQCDVTGDEMEIALLYSKNINDSPAEHFHQGDTLFTLTRDGKSFVTRWKILTPRLAEKPPRECSCFRQ